MPRSPRRTLVAINRLDIAGRRVAIEQAELSCADAVKRAIWKPEAGLSYDVSGYTVLALIAAELPALPVAD